MVASKFKRPLIRLVFSGDEKDMPLSRIGPHDEVVCWIRKKDDKLERLELRLDQYDSTGKKVGKYIFVKVKDGDVTFDEPKTDPE